MVRVELEVQALKGAFLQGDGVEGLELAYLSVLLVLVEVRHGDSLDPAADLQADAQLLHLVDSFEDVLKFVGEYSRCLDKTAK